MNIDIIVLVNNFEKLYNKGLWEGTMKHIIYEDILMQIKNN